MAATPSPLSAPSVVPFAPSHSPRCSKEIGSSSKSCVVSAFFSVTMSRCPWSTTGAAPSPPFCPGRFSSTLPTASCRNSTSLRSSANAFISAMMRSSFLLGRGTDAIAAKDDHTSCGLRPATASALFGVVADASASGRRPSDMVAYSLTAKRRRPESCRGERTGRIVDLRPCAPTTNAANASVRRLMTQTGGQPGQHAARPRKTEARETPRVKGLTQADSVGFEARL